MEEKRTNRKDMYRKENFDKDGKLISYTLRCAYKDYRTGKYKNNTRTWKIPQDLTGKKEIQKALNEEISKFRKDTLELSNGKQAQSGVGFIDYAKNEWLKKVIKNKSKSYAHRAIEAIRRFEEYFGKITFDKLTPDMVKNYYDEMQDKDIHKPKIYLKKSFDDVVLQKYKNQNDFCRKNNISKTTLVMAKKGHPLNQESVDIICNALDIKPKDYFKFVDTEVRYYKKESVLKYKRIMCTIFNNAVRDRVLQDNYTSQKYMKLEFQEDSDDGKVKEENVLNLEESKKFIECLNKIKDKRQVVYFSTLLFGGLRSCEMNGLRWSDIDFENRKISIKRDRLYTGTYGVVEGETKTKSSRRTFTMSTMLMNSLLNYKKWYDEYVSKRKDIYKDDHLMIALEGGLMHPCTPKGWLTKLLNANKELKKISCHGLRHTFITQGLLAGIPVKSIASIVGHADASVTLKVYAHFIQEGDLDAANKLDAFYKAA